MPGWRVTLAWPPMLIPPLYTPGERVHSPLVLWNPWLLSVRRVMVLGSGGGRNRSGSGVGSCPELIGPLMVPLPTLAHPGTPLRSYSVALMLAPPLAIIP